MDPVAGYKFVSVRHGGGNLKKKMKCLFSVIISVVVAISTVNMDTIAANTTKNVYCQKQARQILSYVNKLRQKDAWYRSESGKKVWKDDLDDLEWDDELENIAKKRAKELSVSYSHTRPNGKSCFSLYGDEYGAMGENIAAGYASPKAVFDAWAEANDDYDGQGHRRNMLNESFDHIGMACFRYKGIKFWVQEFGGESLDYDYDDEDDDDYDYDDYD